MKLFKRIFRRAAAPQTVFVMALLVLALPNLCLAVTEPVPFVYRLVNILLPVSLYAAALTFRQRPGLVLWVLFPLVFLSAFQFVLIYLYGHSVIAVDMFLNLLTTNPGEAGELLDNLLPGLAFIFAVYVPTLLLGALSIRRSRPLPHRWTRVTRLAASAGAAAGLLLLVFATGKAYRAANDLYPVNVFQNIRLAVLRTRATARYAETSRHFTFHARPTHPADEREVYVLVIGETARAPQFRLYGYHRNTTPRLSAMRGLFAFDKALTQSNTTHKSVPMLLSAVSAADYDSIYTRKGIITAFREAGFHTVFLSNQLPNHSFIDFFGEEADEWKFVKEPTAGSHSTAGDGYDADLLAPVDEVLRRKRRKQLIVLHTYGSHFEYRKRYPRSMARFLPDNADEAEASNRASLVNGYDNTIRYTDRLIALLIDRLAAQDAASALLYTSDHGENIFDDSRHLFLHASPVPSYYELHVPLLVWLSPRYRALNPAAARALSANARRPVATSVSVFHTFVHLAGIRTPRLLPTLSVAHCAYRPAPALYLDDHNEARPLQQMVRSRQDRLLFRRAGMPLPQP